VRERYFLPVGKYETQLLGSINFGKNKSLMLLACASRRQLKNTVFSSYRETRCLFFNKEELLHPDLGTRKRT
jgi:hypothetical protein